MKTLSILATILTAFVITSASAADTTTPMQCNLTCKTDYTVIAGMQADAESEVDAELSKPVMVADAANPLAPAKPESVMYANGQPSVNDLIATQNGSTGGFDFVTECLKYQGKIWAWREGKCKSMSPDWQSPGIGNTIQQ